MRGIVGIFENRGGRIRYSLRGKLRERVRRRLGGRGIVFRRWR